MFLRQTAADKVTALYAAQAITAALFARLNGDGGQHLELSMADAVVSFLWADSAGNEVLLDADGSLNSSFVAGFQPMRFEDGWGIVVPTSDADFQGMCQALDVEGWDDPRVATMAQRREHRDVMEPIMDMVYANTVNLTQAEATKRFEQQRVPFSMILSPDQLTRDEHAVAIGMFVEDDHHIVGKTRTPRATPRASVAPPPSSPTTHPASGSTLTRSSPSSVTPTTSPACASPASSPDHPNDPGRGQSTGGCSSAISRSLFLRILSSVPGGNSSTT